MSATRFFSKYLKYPFLLCTLLVIALFLNACGGEEEPVPAEEIAPVEAVTPPVIDSPPVEVPPGLEMGEIVPATLGALRFMPSDAQIAIGIPSLPALRDSYLPLVKALQPSKDMDEELAEAIFDLGDGIGVQAETIEELATTLGVDAQAGIAVFGDLRQAVPSRVRNTEGSGQGESDTTETDPTQEQTVDRDDTDEPLIAVVFGISDPTTVRDRLEKIRADDDKLSALPASEETVDGIVVNILGDYAHFMTTRHLVIGNVSLVKGAAERVKSPAPLRYGSVECPAKSNDEIALLIYGNRLFPLLKYSMPLLPDDINDAALPMIQSQIDSYQGLFADGDKEDPMVVTLSHTGQSIEILVRADMNANPGLLEVSGPAQPLRLARYLPDHTLAMLSVRFNEVFKKQLMEDIMPAAQAGGAGDLAIAAQIVPQLGDELTLGITDVKDGEADIYLMLGLAQPQATRGMLEMFLPMEDGVEHNGYTINTVSAPSPFPLYLSFVDDFALAGTSEAGMKSIIDRHKSKEVSSFYAAMDPPFDIDVPRYQALSINADLLGAPADYLVGSFGADADEEPATKLLRKALRELRTSKEFEDGWLKGRISVHFNDLDTIKAAMETYEAASNADVDDIPTDSPSDTSTDIDVRSESAETPQ